MRIIATPRTAALTGLWTVLGAFRLDLWEQGHPRSTYAYEYAAGIVSVLFFFIPVLLFVVGLSYIQRVYQTFGMKWQVALRGLWADRVSAWRDVFGPLYFRMLCWFL